jgi:hypothetical protein
MNSMENFANGILIETLTGTRVLTVNDPIVCKLDPGGAGRTVTLDGTTTGAGGRSGAMRVIVNAADAAEDLTVKDASANTIGTVSQNELGVFMTKSSDNTWTLAYLQSIALS